MDLTQVKLTKTEWDSIEIPIIEKEKYILNMIITGYTNIIIRSNANQSIVQYLRMADSPNIDEYIYRSISDFEHLNDNNLVQIKRCKSDSEQRKKTESLNIKRINTF